MAERKKSEVRENEATEGGSTRMRGLKPRKKSGRGAAQS